MAVFALSCVKGPKPPCVDDPACYAERITTCEPASVVLSGPIAIDGKSVEARLRSTVIGQRGSRCHVTLQWLGSPLPAAAIDAGVLAPTMQCLFTPEEGTALARRLSSGGATQSDLDACYPDGDCGPVPLLSVGCVLDRCVLGRWTYTCELGGKNGRADDIVQCRGTRRSDRSPPDAGCASYCEGGPELLDCRAHPRKLPSWIRE